MPVAVAVVSRHSLVAGASPPPSRRPRAFTRRAASRSAAMAGPPDAPSPSDPAPPSRTLVTFDVDGTLIRAVGEGANQFHKDAFAVAIEAVHGLKTHIDVIKHHGSTDQLVVADVLRHHGFAEDAIWSNMPATCEKMLEHAAETEADAANGLELLPGVRELLETLAARTDVVVGLVTGNLAPIAWAKMRALKIDRLFSRPPPSDAAAPPGAILEGTAPTTSTAASSWCSPRGEPPRGPGASGTRARATRRSSSASRFESGAILATPRTTSAPPRSAARSPSGSPRASSTAPSSRTTGRPARWREGASCSTGSRTPARSSARAA